MRCALVYCLVVDLTISVLVPVGLLFHDVELDVGGKAAKGFPEQQCLGAEARRGGFVEWLPCYAEEQVCVDSEAGSDPRGHLRVTWGVYLCAGKPPLADIIPSHPPDLTRCDSLICLAIPAMSGHIQYRGAASGDLYIRISGINRVLLS